MLPYEEGRKLENLLGTLFGDGDEAMLEDIVVLNEPFRLIILTSECCSYNYAGYNR